MSSFIVFFFVLFFFFFMPIILFMVATKKSSKKNTSVRKVTTITEYADKTRSPRVEQYYSNKTASASGDKEEIIRQIEQRHLRANPSSQAPVQNYTPVQRSPVPVAREPIQREPVQAETFIRGEKAEKLSNNKMMRQFEDRSNDWLAREIREEQRKKFELDAMFALKASHYSDCEAEAVRESHFHNCDAEGIDDGES